MIDTLGLISNSTAVVIGAMTDAPLMDPILSLAFGLAVSDGKLIRRSAVTISLVVFLLQRYGSFRTCWRNLLALLGLLGLVSLPLSSALHDFSVRQEMDAEFGRFKAGQLKRVAIAQSNP